MIALCEPQCVGFEHTEFNAALIATVRAARPRDRIVFFAEAEHLRLVLERLRAAGVPRILGETIQVPPRQASNTSRAARELSLLREVFGRASHEGAAWVILCSVTSPGLLATRALLPLHPRLHCLVVPHSILESVPTRPARWHRGFPFWFRHALALPGNERLRFLLLGSSIAQRLLLEMKEVPALRDAVSVLDHPYLFDESAKRRRVPGPLRFGTLGVADRRKGAELFFHLASEVQRRVPAGQAHFSVIGRLADELRIPAAERDSAWAPPPGRPLSREEFVRLAREQDYAVLLHDPQAYALTASGSFLDAVAYGTPLVALSNPYFAHYFERFGDLGHLCGSYDEAQEVVLSLVAGAEPGRRERQRENLKHARQALSPAGLAPALERILRRTPG